jgi:peptidoglycan/LPS O-acetylase OafA/YrhL
VLTLPMLQANQQDYLTYAVRRTCRIYLPYVAALMVALAGCWKFHGLEMYGPIFRTLWRSAPSLPLVAAHLAFLGRYDVFAYNPPTWSLVHEMRISLIFPLLCLVSLRLRAWAAFAIALSFPIAGRLVEKYSAPYTGDGLGTHGIFWAKTISYCGIFLIGSLLARYRGPLATRLAGLPAALRWLFLAAAAALYQFPMFLPVPWYLRDFAVALGAAYFVMLALVPDGWLSRLLRRSPLRFLGRISYSLYLVHVPILMVMSIAIWGKVSFVYLLLPFLAVSLVAAAVFYRVVERPSIALGKAIGRKWRIPATMDDGNSVVTEPVA